jgi:YhcN/YlaJ family sporulation lipoprotein
VRKSRFFLVAVAFLLAFSVFLGMTGCQPAQRPLPRTKTTTPAPVPKTATPAPAPGPNTTTPSPGPAMKPLPTKPAEISRLMKKLDDEAENVSGVKKAYTVISGTSAFVGIEMANQAAAGDKNTTEANNTEAVKEKVASQLEKTEPRLTTVNVTATPDLVERLRKVAEGVQKGTPLTSFSTEMAEITRRGTPTTRG